MNDNKDFYPKMIKDLPEADISFKGLRGWLSQGKDHQIVFFDIDPIGIVPEHTHGIQWGCVLDGEITFTIDGKTKTYQKGDSYFIPAGVVHSASFTKPTKIIEFFDDKDRYKIK